MNKTINNPITKTIKCPKIIALILAIMITIISLTGCVQPDPILPDLSGKNRAQITKILKQKGYQFTFKIIPMLYTSEQQYDQFIKYGSDFAVGDLFDQTKLLVVYTTALHLTFSNTKDAIGELDYQGKDFITDGIGEVRLYRSIDGDTAHFIDQNNNIIKVRFLGIDTPESTYDHEPWGSAAADFTRNILNNAKTIVLEAEGNRKDTYDRYLAFVWVDGMLLNLELVNQAYSTASISYKSKYYQLFVDAEIEASMTGRRVYGEIDPDFKY